MRGRLRHPRASGDQLLVQRQRGHRAVGAIAAIARQGAPERPVILLSTTGTKLLCQRGPYEAMYAACLRNYRAQADWVLDRHARIAVVG